MFKSLFRHTLLLYSIVACCPTAHCIMAPDNLRVDENPACSVAFVQVGGEIDVISRGCTIQTIATPSMSQEGFSENMNVVKQLTYHLNNFTCKQDIDNDYETNCICSTDFCNSRFPLPIKPKPPIFDLGHKLIVDELNRSIRQLRSDIKRTIAEEVQKAIICN